ncbi:pre-rRNA-processing protein TSR2 homolog [Glycine soja]|nr:pre-rRNA-processing protein TSR2 homolog [Glycine soja]KHN30478.1 Pre-rRNA-processing protein TSR2 like [Glycine soja]
MNVFLSTHTEVFSMDFINRNHFERKEINPKIFLQKSIILLLSHWYALQMAVENQWGGYDSLQKSHQLAADLFSWLSKSNALIPIEDLESLLHECMLLTFNTEIEDGSIEQVAEQLLAIHEEYLSRQSS